MIVALSVFIFKGMREPFNGPTWVVSRERLQMTIVERGALESAENSDIICRVKAGNKGTVATTIRWVIEDGAQVEPNDVLMLLDDSGLQDQLKTQINIVNNSRADWIQAKENYFIVQSQSFSDMESAKVIRDIAEINLKKYLGNVIADQILARVKTRAELQAYLLKEFEKDLHKQESELEQGLRQGEQNKTLSEFLQARSDIKGRLEDSRAVREQGEDRASWSQRMVKKGYVSRSQGEADLSKLESAKNNFKKIQLEYEILHKYTLEATVTDLWSKVKEAERAIERVDTQTRSKKVQAETDRDNKRIVYFQEEAKKAEIEDEIRKCTILSPQYGLVVYFMPEQSRYGGGSQQSIIAQGEPVREGQKMMRIPNLSRMVVNTKVHEAMVSRIKGEVLRPTYFTDALRAGLLVSANPLDLTVKQFAFFEVRDQYREQDYKKIFPGLKAKIRVEAHAGKTYAGHVKSVAAVASQAEFFSSDVKVYTTMVSIDAELDPEVENLKPGMSAEVTILADETSDPVLTIPIQAVVGNVSMGAKRKCFVLDGGGQPKERDIEVGISNDRLVEVRSGLAEGERVVLNPRPLLGEKSNMKAGIPGGSRRGADGEESGAGGGKKGKKDGGKGKGSLGAPSGPNGAGGPGFPAEEKKWQGRNDPPGDAFIEKGKRP